MKAPLTPLLAVATLLAGVAALYAVHETHARRVEPESIVALVEPLAMANDIELKKSKGKYKYKKDDVDDAQQGWKIAGEMPTSYYSFNSMGSVRVRGRRAGDVDTLNHTIPLDTTGIKGRDGTRFQQKFSYFKAGRSGGGQRLPKWGFIKMWLEIPSAGPCCEGTEATGNRLRFLYVVTKANQGGQMLETEYQNDIKQKVAEEKKVSGQENLEFGFRAGTESHDASATAKYKAKKKGARGSIL
jgi:hypothetical protein